MTIAPSLNWLELSTTEFGQWAARRRLALPFPLSASAVASVELPLEELLALPAASADGEDTEHGLPWAGVPRRDALGTGGGSADGVLDVVGYVLGKPDFTVYASRTTVDGAEFVCAGIARNSDAVVVIVAPDGTVRISGSEVSELSAAVIAQLPAVLGAPLPRIEIAQQAADLIDSGFVRKVGERTLVAAMDSAGIPPALADRLLRGNSDVTAYGVIGAVRVGDDGERLGSRTGAWTERPDGSILQSKGAQRTVVFEPASPAALLRVAAAAVGSAG